MQKNRGTTVSGQRGWLQSGWGEESLRFQSCRYNKVPESGRSGRVGTCLVHNRCSKKSLINEERKTLGESCPAGERPQCIASSRRIEQVTSENCCN